MSAQPDKRKRRLLSKPSDYTFTEAESLLISLGFKKNKGGKTSGSRLKFTRSTDGRRIYLHKPHPGNELKKYAINDLITALRDMGEL